MPIDPRRIEVMDDRVAAIMRRKSPQERLAIAMGMWRSARELVEAAVLHQHPTWTRDQITREIAKRMSHGAV